MLSGVLEIKVVYGSDACYLRLHVYVFLYR